MAGADGYVQVAPDGSGKEIATRQISVAQPDGTTATVHLQVVAIADKNGAMVDLTNLALLANILDELKQIRFLLERIAT